MFEVGVELGCHLIHTGSLTYIGFGQAVAFENEWRGCVLFSLFGVGKGFFDFLVIFYRVRHEIGACDFGKDVGVLFGFAFGIFEIT